jgi:aerobic-type carbon monoxide dehydrogenase small subunit (CoxS/CutS family)
MAQPVEIKFAVNGKPVAVTTEPQRTLLEVLREGLHLTGTKYGCGEGACGACTVLVEDASQKSAGAGGRDTVFSCSTPVSDIAGKSITTIEGLATGETLHPAQEAFMAESAFQCGYCTPGMIMGTVALLGRTPNPSDAEIRNAMNGHICRCCTYERIHKSVRRASAQLARK